MMETTSKTPEMRDLSFAPQINKTIHGIPNDSDKQKRKLAQNILTPQEGFVSTIFLTTNGDVYMT
jgi:hypothetical protein